ncbi:hypothetical protein SH661x_002481 [Planctomicrobium sp. SH661]|uniref:hypothetical protein n=1 Tax=Planctomicrobium sp. SH661 TaxID=3448124 RepID=UPI003F5B2C6E
MRLRIVLLLAVLSMTGCGAGNQEGPKRFVIRGDVNFNGVPVPKGSVLFAPDDSKGNSGPGTLVRIEEGRFTMTRPQGVIGGPHVLTISGFDGVQPPGVFAPDGTTLFPPYKLEKDLPASDSTITIDVPATESRTGEKTREANQLLRSN